MIILLKDGKILTFKDEYHLTFNPGMAFAEVMDYQSISSASPQATVYGQLISVATTTQTTTMAPGAYGYNRTVAYIRDSEILAVYLKTADYIDTFAQDMIRGIGSDSSS